MKFTYLKAMTYAICKGLLGSKEALYHLAVYLRNGTNILGSGCGSVGRAVASDTRGSRFESSHQQTFIRNICLLSTVLKRRK